MSEFELSTLAVLALLLFAIGAYSYWQVHRAQKAQEARKAELAELAVEPPTQHRYPAYVPEQEPLPETWPSAPASVQSEQLNSPAIAYRAETSEASEVFASPASQTTPSNHKASTTDPFENDEPAPSMVAVLEEEALDATPQTQHDASDEKPEPLIETTIEATTDDAQETDAAMMAAPAVNDKAPPLTSHAVDVRLASEHAQTALDKSTANPSEDVAPNVIQTSSTTSAHEPNVANISPVLVESPVVAASTAAIATVQSEALGSEAKDAPTASAIAAMPDEMMSAIIAEPPTAGKSLPVTFDLDDEEEKERIAQRVTAQEMKRRATWEVFAPFARFEHWLHTAHPQGVDPIRAIDAEIVIAVNQPKTAEDIERALYDLRLDTPLPMRLYGARAGQISLESGSKRVWQDLQAGAPYSAIKLTLQLANRSHYAQEEVIQRWFGLAEAVRKRLAGHIDTLPDVYELSEYAQFLHALARRVGQPIILQLHKDNGLWPAYEVHQQLTACGAVLGERGIYVARSERNTPVYAVMNDVNNPRAQDFLRSQMAVMYVHTLSFCVELARIELRSDDSAAADAQPLEPIQRLISDMKAVADALGAQWQNHLGEEISVDELEKIAHLQTRIFVRQLSELGLPVGALMTKRLLLG